MRLGFGLASAVLALAACSDRPAELATQWGCGPVEGLKAVSDSAWVLVGEFSETSEAPAAIADIACNLATDERKLFVGVSEYVGGASDAETRLLEELDGMIAKGAPIIVAKIGGEERPYAVHERSKAEKAWAGALTGKVRATGAARALLLVPRVDAMARAIPPAGDRFAGYDPMPTFLEGDVVSLEVAANPIPGAPGPAIRINREMKDGFHGQLALQSLTRPMIAVAIPETATTYIGEPVTEIERKQMERQLRRLRDSEVGASGRGEGYGAGPALVPERDALVDQLTDDLPQFKAE
jgi:hypothetical protein